MMGDEADHVTEKGQNRRHDLNFLPFYGQKSDVAADMPFAITRLYFISPIVPDFSQSLTI